MKTFEWRRRLTRLALGLSLFLASVSSVTAAGGALQFRAQEIESQLGIGYGVVIEDVNHDGKPDIVAINETQVLWYENPGWRKHVILDGVTEADNVCLAAHDIDRDGKVDVAIGAAWRPQDTQGGGTLQWIGRTSDAQSAWALYPIGSEPTVHRIRWGDVDGDGRAELLVAPLHGRGTKAPKSWEGNGARLLVLRPPARPATQPWAEEVADDSFHVMHNFWVANFDEDPADELITASYEGVHVLDRGPDGKWKRLQIGKGHQQGDADKGAGEVKMGRLNNGRRYIATIEPWHANHVVIYEEAAGSGAPWKRKIAANKLGGGHALWTADLDGDGDEELAVGWRLEGEGDFKKPGVAVFDPGDWSYQVIDSGGMATEDITAADLDGDGKPEIIASGRATHNLKIYWNEN